MQPYVVHQFVHDKRRTCHIARRLHQRNTKVENQYVRQEYQHSANTRNDTIYQQVAQHTRCHHPTQPRRKHPYSHLYPFHRICPNKECCIERDEQRQKEYRITKPLARHHIVYLVGQRLTLLFGLRHVGLLQCSCNESILRIAYHILRRILKFCLYLIANLIQHPIQPLKSRICYLLSVICYL